ncbi:SAM-dependent methyltransferase [Pleionea sediminis]|uniref:SAM-dependent methyltransferase n=1 Tax=Pleionea sediminis TaxID=2569479 RepID=UPI0011857FCF|nr:methyltransferase domain-containing protein [Pleionea sediminis]
MSGYTGAVEAARSYYNSDDADNFYFHIWGGEDIHVGIYKSTDESIRDASRRTVTQMADLLGNLDKTTRVLDAGSGYGGSARYLAKRFGCQITALNVAETENTRNRQMTEEQGLSNLINVEDGSFEDIKAENESFDVIWSQDAVLHSGDREKVMAEFARVLKPGGQLIFTDPMQADDCPEGVLDKVLQRIHLDTLGSIAFYREHLKMHGLQEVGIEEMTQNLITHYGRVAQELKSHRAELKGKVSEDYIERMLTGLGHWVEAGEKGYLSWGILHFRKS